MYKYVLICWLFGIPELSGKEVRDILEKISPEEKEELDFFKVLEGGDLENNLQAVREVAKEDFIFDVADFGIDNIEGWED